MSWHEYTVASLDLTEESPIPGSRPYRQGRLRLDGSTIFVRFIRDEAPWAGGTQYASRAEARAALAGPAYTAPPTAEEIAQEAQALADHMEDKLLRIAERKIGFKITGLPLEGRYLSRLEEAATEVRANGDQAGNAIIDDLSAQYGINITRTVDKALLMIANADERADAVHNIVAGGLRAIKRDEDVQPFIDALQAL